MGLESNIALVVASLDLKLVQLLRQAIRVADLSGVKENGPLHPEPEILRRKHIEPQPLIEPRRHIHPQTEYEPRPVIHPRLRVEPAPPTATASAGRAKRCMSRRSPSTDSATWS